MKKKLEELKKKRYTAQCELDTIDEEIKDLENQILNSDVRLYKGKWFYKSEDWWDEYENCYKGYEIVYVNNVRVEFGHTYLSVIIIKMDHYWKLRNFNIETDDDYNLRDLKEMEEMTDHVFYQMDETIKQLLTCLFNIRPLLKDFQ